jgi:hypothetical protein
MVVFILAMVCEKLPDVNSSVIGVLEREEAYMKM